jgi:hypothetical protein
MTYASATDSFRWKNYVLFNNQTIHELWNPSYCRPHRKVLYILGAGFDVRMNMGLTNLLQRCPGLDVTCLVVGSKEAVGAPATVHSADTAQNLLDLQALLPSTKLITRNISLYATDANYAERRYLGDKSAVNHIITSIDDLQQYQDVYLDISSLSRGLYISLAGKILFLLDAVTDSSPRTNFFILATENAVIDALIKEEGFVGHPQFLQGFSLSFSDIKTQPLLWLPMLGEHKQTDLLVTHDELRSKKQKMEIFPVLPFPSRDPRRSDNLFGEHHQLLFDVLTIDFKDVLYVPEQNPYEVYLGLTRTIARFHHSMQLLGGCRVALSPFSSKLLSVGALLASYELNKYRQSIPALQDRAIDVGIITTVSESYAAPARSELLAYHQDSEVFVTWISGEPYAPLSNDVCS